MIQPNISTNNHNLLSTYFEKRTNTFLRHFKNTREHYGVDDLHQMRVEIKKLRAFLRMFELISENSFQKSDHYHTLAKIFKPGGRLRETQVNLSLVEKYSSFRVPYYKLYLIGRETKQTWKLRITFENFDINELEQLNQQLLPQLELFDAESLHDKIYPFISSEMDTIRNLRPEISNEKELHKLRMHLKAMGYIIKLLNEILIDEKLGSLILKIKPTETLIGNWHDRVVLISSLKRYLKKNSDSPDKEEIVRLTNQVEKRNIEAVEEIGARIDELLGLSVL